jgi:N4-gp56 family major capsid protein
MPTNNPTSYPLGATWAVPPTMPTWQRVYYEEQLLDSIRMRSILLPYARVAEDFNALKTQQIVWSEVYDLEPNWSPTTEQTIWFKGGSMDSRTITLQMHPYHDIVKFGDYQRNFTYFSPAFDAIVKERIGQQITDVLDIHCRNAFLQHPYITYMNNRANRAALVAGDLFDPDMAEVVRAHLEDHDVPGVVSVSADDIPAILCITTTRVCNDIRTAAGSDWIDVHNYHATGKKFTGEVGSWAGVRFIKTNRNRLRNAGTAIAQTTLAADTVPGQGAAATVDQVYTPGQPNSVRFIQVVDVTDFAVGQYITIHDQNFGLAVDDTDGSQEVRRIISIDALNDRISLDKPLLKDHADGDIVTHGIDIHSSVFLGGPSIVWAVAERPTLTFPPKIDDAMMVNRLGWRGLWDVQSFRPEWYEVVLSTGSADPIQGP